MKLKDVLDDGRVQIYEFNKSLTGLGMFGAMLYQGEGKLIKSKLLDREVIRLFEYNIPVYIVF